MEIPHQNLVTQPHLYVRVLRITICLVISLTTLLLLSRPVQVNASQVPDSAFSTDGYISDINFSNQVTTTNMIYLSMIHASPPEPRSLGIVDLLAGPFQCDDQNCYNVSVNCPDITQDITATLKVGEPISNTLQGTILFVTGWTGTYYFDGGPEPHRIIGELRASGYRTVQLKWANNWWLADIGIPEGHARLACRPASVIRWVYDNLNQENPKTAFCASGNSNGASQISYAMAQYDLADLFSAIELDGGPNWSRLDAACLQDDPAYQSLWFDDNERNLTDWAFGDPYNDNVGPCASQDVDFREQFQDASLAYGQWQYFYPKTMVWFLFGESDTTITKAHGLYFYNYLLNFRSQLVNMDIVPNTDHIVSETQEGADMIRDIFLNECHLP
jgi:hypothetical protein